MIDWIEAHPTTTIGSITLLLGLVAFLQRAINTKNREAWVDGGLLILVWILYVVGDNALKGIGPAEKSDVRLAFILCALISMLLTLLVFLALRRFSALLVRHADLLARHIGVSATHARLLQSAVSNTDSKTTQ